MKRKKLYYLEDTREDFEGIVPFLDEKKLEIVPGNIKDWLEEIETMKLMVQINKRASRAAVEAIFKKYQADIYVIDYMIQEPKIGGKIIFNEVLKKHDDFSKKIFVFISQSRGDMTIPYNDPNVRNTPKIFVDGGTAIDYKKTGEALMDTLQPFLPQDRSRINKLIKKGGSKIKNAFDTVYKNLNDLYELRKRK